MSRKGRDAIKWSFGDVFIAIVEIAIPIAALLVVFFVPALQGDSKMDVRLSIIGLGIVAPIVLLQLSVNSGQNKIETAVKNLEIKIDTLDNDLQHLSPVLEKVFISNNDRIKRFAFRRAETTYNVIQAALNNQTSGILTVSEYYAELEFLAQLIISDKNNKKKDFHGEIWAMTSFAVEEWSDDGYESAWTDKLRETVRIGIPTKRLCVISKEIQSIISKSPFAEPSDKINPYYGFKNLLRDYYGKDATPNIATHYCIKEGDVPELTQERGFFAIKLTDGELHILTGETVNSVGALTAQVLFDQEKIKSIRALFDRQCRTNTQIEKVIPELAKNSGFIKHLKEENIELANDNSPAKNGKGKARESGH